MPYWLVFQRLIKSIKIVQYKLDDFCGEHIPSIEEKARALFGIEPDNPLELKIDDEGVLCLPEDKCPKCGGKLREDGKNKKIVMLPYSGKQEVFLKRYECGKCGNKITTPLPDYEKGKHHASWIQTMSGMLRGLFSIPLRKVKEILGMTRGIAPSHETIRQYEMKFGREYEKLPGSLDDSGIYCYDEQYLDVNGVERYRLALKDATSGDTIAEEIAKDKQAGTVYLFWKKHLLNRAVRAIITDMDKTYSGLIKELEMDIARKRNVSLDESRILHQFCVFHAEKWFSREIHETLCSIKTWKGKYQENYDNEKRVLWLLFSLDNKERTEYHLGRLREDWRNWVKSVIDDPDSALKDKARRMFEFISRCRHRYHPRIAKVLESLDDKWDNLTLFYDYPEIPKTNNTMEHHFALTNPERVKKRFKTDLGLHLHLNCKAFFNRLSTRNHYDFDNVGSLTF